MIVPGPLVHVLDLIGLASLVALGLVLLTTVAGQTSFGQAGFAGLGAYTGAVLTVHAGWPAWPTLPCALAAAAAGAWLIGQLSLRMRGHYLPLGTIAWGLSLYYLFGTLPQLGGFGGIGGLGPLRIGPWTLDGPAAMAAPIALAVVAAGWMTRNLLDSRIGRNLRCLRARAAVLEAFGVDPTRLRIQVFVFAALLAATSGWLYAHLQHFVSPGPFSLNAGIEYLFMAVIGGSGGGVSAALTGAATVIVAKEALQRVVPGALAQGGAAELILFGVLVIVLLQRARGGLLPVLQHAGARWRGGSGEGRDGAAGTSPAGTAAPGAVFGPAAVPAAGAAGGAVAAAASGGTVATATAAAAAAPAATPPLLSVRGAVRRFAGLVAVDGVDLDVRAGEVLGLIGPNGAGKSTLFDLIGGQQQADAGTVRIDGDVLAASPRARARAGLARSFQHVQLVDAASVRDNVAIGATGAGRRGWLASLLRADRAEERALQATAREAIARVGLTAQAERPCGTLPLGSQRLVEIARALACRPRIVLLDEPAAGLRHAEKQALAALVRDLRDAGIAVVLVEHDMDFVMSLCDRLVVLQFGRVIARGTPAQIQADPVVHAAYLGDDADAPPVVPSPPAAARAPAPRAPHAAAGEGPA